jgi:hypothetical protein
LSILITAANAAQAYQLKSILNADADVALGDYLEIPKLMVTLGRMIKTPDPNGNTFVHEMLALCLDKGINKVYALRRAELLPLAQARQLFTEFDIALYVPSIALINSNSGNNDAHGKIVVLENGNVVAGDVTSPVFFNLFPAGENTTETGIFKLNAGDYTIFTAD